MTLVEYLNQKYRPRTVESYEREIKLYLANMKNAKTASYQDIIYYLTRLRKDKTIRVIQSRLQGIKAYYNYLFEEEIRTDNPAQFIQLKDSSRSNPAIAPRLLSSEQLEKLWQYFLNKTYCHILLKNRDISLVGLLLKQGLRKKEIEALTLEHINLDKGQIYVPATPQNKERTLALETAQILPFYRYINEVRPKLVQGKKLIHNLFVTRVGTADYGTLQYLIKKAKPLIKNKDITPNTVRISVIAEQFRRGHSLQDVQYFAGHHNPSTTERYQTNDLEALQQSIIKHHPLQ